MWNVPESPTDEEWGALDEGAVTLLVATQVVGLGGTGPMDNDWVKQPAWRAFNRIMIDAGNASLAAIRARDVLALQKAGDVLYPPCEGCHAQFNPGVVEAQSGRPATRSGNTRRTSEPVQVHRATVRLRKSRRKLRELL